MQSRDSCDCQPLDRYSGCDELLNVELVSPEREHLPFWLVDPQKISARDGVTTNNGGRTNVEVDNSTMAGLLGP